MNHGRLINCIVILVLRFSRLESNAWLRLSGMSYVEYWIIQRFGKRCSCLQGELLCVHTSHPSAECWHPTTHVRVAPVAGAMVPRCPLLRRQHSLPTPACKYFLYSKIIVEIDFWVDHIFLHYAVLLALVFSPEVDVLRESHSQPLSEITVWSHRRKHLSHLKFVLSQWGTS
jgi:hypothetical protein